MRLGRVSPLPRPWTPGRGVSGLPRRLGRVGAAGLAALVIALVVALFITPRLRAQAETAREQVAAAARAERDARIAAADRTRRALARDGVAGQGGLPAGHERDARVARLLARAAKEGLVVGGLLQTAAEATSPGRTADATAVQWHTVSLPLRGSYAQIRAFLAAALAADPALALDAVLLQREAGSAPDELRADTRWGFAQRAADPPVRERTP